MITPEFEIEQDHDFVSLSIRCPYTRIEDADLYVHENEIKFYSKPYFLRLNLPANVLNNEHAKIKYDADAGKFSFRFPKETPGMHFEDLDLLTKLLAPKMKPGQKPIEEVNEVRNEDLDDEDGDIWQVRQEIDDSVDILNGRFYGFNRSKTGVIGRMQEVFPNACDIKNPEEKTVVQARAERIEEENSRFDTGYFIVEMLEAKDPRYPSRKILENKINYEEDVTFTPEEQLILGQLPPRGYLMGKTDKLRCLLSLVDLTYAYAYTNRINEGDWNSECGWTVAKLSATLSHLEEFTSMKAVKLSCFRRTLIFPLMRTLAVAEVCWQDAIAILKQGTKRVLKCLLEIHHALGEDVEGRHLLNDLFIKDYCIWLQRQCKPNRLQDAAEKMLHTKVEKDELNLDISSCESRLAVYEETLRRREAEGRVCEDSDDSDAPSSTSAHDSDDYDSFDEWGSSEESSTTTSGSGSTQTSTNRNL